MKFPEALKALNEGYMVRRVHWPVGTFVFRQVPATISKNIVPKMQSLPQSVKSEFQRRFDHPNYQIDAIYYDNQLAKVDNSNLIYGYSPSVEDLDGNWEFLGGTYPRDKSS